MATELKRFREFQEVFGPQIEIHPHWDQRSKQVLRISEILRELKNSHPDLDGELLDRADIPFCRISLAGGVEIFTQVTNYLGEKVIALIADSKNLVSNPDGTADLEVTFVTLDVPGINPAVASDRLILATHLTLASPSAYKTIMALNALNVSEGDNYSDEAQRVVDFYVTGQMSNPPE